MGAHVIDGRCRREEGTFVVFASFFSLIVEGRRLSTFFCARLVMTVDEGLSAMAHALNNRYDNALRSSMNRNAFGLWLPNLKAEPLSRCHEFAPLGRSQAGRRAGA